MKRYPHRLAWRSKTVAGLASLALVAAGALAVTATSAPRSVAGGTAAGTGHGPRSAEDSGELMESIDAFNDARVAPSGVVTPGAYDSAWQHVLGMPVNQASYTDVTTQPYDSDSPHFRDQSASNSGGGAGFSAVRIAALVFAPT